MRQGHCSLTKGACLVLEVVIEGCNEQVVDSGSNSL